jgi:hypothetical protein
LFGTGIPLVVEQDQHGSADLPLRFHMLHTLL